MEIELKLLVAPAEIAAFRRTALLKQLATARPRTKQLHSTYFDTPGLHLKQHGMELRVRRAGKVFIQTLKADGHAAAGLHTRQEWEGRVTGMRPDVPLLQAMLGKGSTWEKLLRAPGLPASLAPVFESSVRRTVWPLRLAQGTEVELVLDQGELSSGDAHEPVSEAELELKAGEPGALFDLALQLLEQVPLRLGMRSKSARGYALRAAETCGPVKAMPIGLEPGVTVEQGFRVIVGNCLAQIQDNEAGVVRGTDPESIHQMRVGLRRLRSALQLFAHWVALAQALQDELGWLGAELGAARDADVLAGQTLAKVGQACPQETPLLRLVQSASTMADEKRKQAARAVDSVRYARLMLGLVGWLQASRWRKALDEVAMQELVEPLEQHAKHIVVRRHEKLVKRAKQLAHATPEQRHQVRIAAKKTRYAAEFFQALYPARRIRRYIKSLAAIQDTLGGFNDAAVADGLLYQIERGHPKLAASASFARGFLHAAAERDMRSLGKRWKKFSALGAP